MTLPASLSVLADLQLAAIRDARPTWCHPVRRLRWEVRHARRQAAIDELQAEIDLRMAVMRLEQRRAARTEHAFVGDGHDCTLCGEGSRHYLHSPSPYEDES